MKRPRASKIRHNLQRTDPTYNEQKKTQNDQQQPILQYWEIGFLL